MLNPQGDITERLVNLCRMRCKNLRPARVVIAKSNITFFNAADQDFVQLIDSCVAIHPADCNGSRYNF